MKTLTAIPISELIKKAGSKRKVAQLAGIQNLGSLSHQSVLIDGALGLQATVNDETREIRTLEDLLWLIQ